MVHHAPEHSDSDWPQQLIRLLEQQQAIVTNLSQLAERQRDLVQREQTDALLGVLARRQELIEQFTGSQEAIGSITKNLDQRLESIGDDERKIIQKLIEEIGEQLAAVMQGDEDDQHALAAARDEVKHELASMDLARQARHAYHRGRAVDNRFADQRG